MSSPSDEPRSSTRAAAIVVAAGRGLRAGGDIPKQFATWRGKPLLRHAVEALAAADLEPIVIAAPAGLEETAREILAGMEGVGVVTGGATRQASVRAALEALAADPPERVLIHDAARPGLGRAVIMRLLEALDGAPAAIPVLPVVDSLLREGSGTVARDGLRRVQTPQAFDFAAILAAHRGGIL